MEDSELWYYGEKLTPENTLVHLMSPVCWSCIELDTGEEIVDILEENDIILSLVRQGYHFQVHGHPKPEYKLWYLSQATEELNYELALFWRSDEP